MNKNNLVSIAWILTVIMGVALGMVLCLVPITEGEGILCLYKYKHIAIVVALVCAGLIEIIMCVGLKGWTIKAVKKEEIKK